MLNFGLWSSSKGMGRIPDLEGLSINDARVAITNAGFNLGNETPLGNSDGATPSNNNKVKGRNDTNSLLNYESVLDFEYYVYSVTPVAPTPTPTPVAPTPVPTPTALPTLPTPSLSVTTAGYNVYPDTVYANIGVGNYSYLNTYTATMGTQNPEHPEEWNLANLSPNTSYTIYITASRSGYNSATGSLTFTSYYVPAPTPTPTPVVSYCTMPNVIGMTEASAATAIVNAGLRYEFTNYTSVGATPENNGTVQSQDPSAGSTVQCLENTLLTIYNYVAPTPVAPTPVAPTPVPTPVVSYCTMPNVIGMDQFAAANAIVASGWLYEYTDTTSVGATPSNNGTVAAQDPAPGTTNVCGLNSGITLYYYVAPTPVAPTPVAPTPVAPTPVASCSGYFMCVNYPAQQCNGGYCVITDSCGNIIGCND